MLCLCGSSTSKVLEPTPVKSEVKLSQEQINEQHETHRRKSHLTDGNIRFVKLKTVGNVALATKYWASKGGGVAGNRRATVIEESEKQDEPVNRFADIVRRHTVAGLSSSTPKYKKSVSFEDTVKTDDMETNLEQQQNRKTSILKSIFKRAARKSTTFGKKQGPGVNVKSDVERLWKIRCSLYRKDRFQEEEITLLRSLISETLDLTGRLRIIVREKDDEYTNIDVENYSKDINGLQLLFDNIIEIWHKVSDPERKKHKDEISADLMELSTDIASIVGEIMLLFLQRFELNILPLLKPLHGLFYGLSLHCKYNCLDKDQLASDTAPSIYSGFLSGILQLFRSAKILLKRLKFDDDASRSKKRLVQTNISSFVSQATVSHGLHSFSTDELHELVLRIGNICTDAFFTMGKTKGLLDHIDLGDGVEATGPFASLGDISHCDFIECPIEMRSVLMTGIHLNDGQHYVSDFYQTMGSSFHSQEKITLRCPIFHASFPASATVRVKAKSGDKWTDLEGDIIAGKCEFKASFMEAFVVVAGYRPYHREITPLGFTYMSEDDSRIRINFPKNCFSRPCIVQFRLIQMNRHRIFSYKESCPDECKYITCISDVIFIKHDDDVIINEPALIHMPIINDVDDYETEIVVFRKRSDGAVEVISRPSAMRCESTGNCYTFQLDRFCGVALGKASKRQLKRNRRAIIDEFNLYYETEHICIVLTFMDRASLQAGVIKIWTEVVEKRFMKRTLRMRLKDGLFEVPGSRSPDIRMKDYDVIRIDLEGSIGKIRDISHDHYFISFLSSSYQNSRTFPVEPRRDPRRSNGILNYYRESGNEDRCIHMVSIDVNRFIMTGTRLPTSHAETRPVTQYARSVHSRDSLRSSKSTRSMIAYRAMFDELPVLSHQSLLVLAASIPQQRGPTLGVSLNLPYEDILDIKARNQPTVITNFEILWKWRGKIAHREMVDTLTHALRENKLRRFSEIITMASLENRALKHSDFAQKSNTIVKFQK